MLTLSVPLYNYILCKLLDPFECMYCQLSERFSFDNVCRKVIKWIKRRIWPETKEQKMSRSPWEKDYRLQPAETTSLFYEYLEMSMYLHVLFISCVTSMSVVNILVVCISLMFLYMCSLFW